MQDCKTREKPTSCQQDITPMWQTPTDPLIFIQYPV